ncbi:RNase adapter RapZ [Streptomyces sp. NPDC047315]|uniref:RapZ C-terminal domain-containing protein n=1 Tax=Streptomyces sp. NPDC047315 TaxID=3155142 RepID=UPI0033E7D7CF
MNPPLLRVVSFGYGHGPAPTADITLDLRRSLRNPHHDPAMRHMTGLDERVYQHVLDTPGARHLAAQTTLAAHMLLTETSSPVVTVAAGCVGGRHRAVAMAREIEQQARSYAAAAGYEVQLVHRDVHRDVLPSSVHS